jgi:hypothetical protein
MSLRRLAAVAACLVATAAFRIAAADGTHRYQIKAGSVVMSNSMVEGVTTTMYFDDFGAKSATVTKTHMTVMGTTVDNETWDIKANGVMIKYDAKKKTGTRWKLTGAMASAGQASGIDVEKMAASANASKKDLAAKTVAGKSCSGMEVTVMGMTIRAWTWKGLPLYSETFMGGLDKPPIVQQATKIDEGAPPATVFTVPSDVKLTEG